MFERDWQMKLWSKDLLFWVALSVLFGKIVRGRFLVDFEKILSLSLIGKEPELRG